MNRHCAAVACIGPIPHAVEQILPREDLTRVVGEKDQEIEFAGGELDLPAVAFDLAAIRPYDQRTKIERIALGDRWRRRRPAQDRFYPRYQLARTERFPDVIVSADTETDDGIDLVALRGHHDHRYIA